MNKIFIVNKRLHSPTKNDFYIGRGSALGCPFTILPLEKTKAVYQCSTKEEAIDKYEGYLNEMIDNGDKEICDRLNEMYLKALDEDINLVCYCSPDRCHGEVIRSLLISKLVKHYMNKVNL